MHWKDWCWSWNSNTLATWYEELTHFLKPRRWEWLKAGGEGDDGGWAGWMASSTQWTWAWVSSKRWWWTGKPGVLQSMGSQRVRHDWATELKWVAQTVKNLPAMQETCVPFLGWEDLLKKGIATHSSMLPLKIPWTEEHNTVHGITESDTTEQITHTRYYTVSV